MDMSLPECAAQLGAAMLTIQQMGAVIETVKLMMVLLGIGLGVVVCSLFYEWRYYYGLECQRQLDRPMRAVSWSKRIKTRFADANAWATKWHRKVWAMLRIH